MGRLRAFRLEGGTGEPLLDHNLPRIVALANEYAIADWVEVTTNASALTERLASDLIDAGLTYMRVSVYGTTEDQQGAVTQSGVSLDRIERNVAALMRIRTYRGSTTPYVYAKFIDTGNEATNRAFRNRWTPLVDEIAVEGLHDWTSEEPGRRHGGIKQPGHKRACTYPFVSLTIRANGDVVGCTVDWTHATAVGNLHSQSIIDIWNGERLRAFHRMHLEGHRGENPSCANCTWLNAHPDTLDDVPVSEHERILASG